MTEDDVEPRESLTSAMRDAGPIEDHLHALATEASTPALALGHCLIRIAESGPVLRGLIEKGADGAALTAAEDLLLFRGLYVLGGARDPLAFKPLLRLLRRPNYELEALLGDSITEALSRIVAGTFDGDAEALLNAIADRSIEEYIRNALFGAATYLAWEGRIGREPFIALLERFHRDRLAVAGDMAWVGWMEAIALLPLPEMKPLVDEAFRDGWIDDLFYDRADFYDDLAEATRAPTDIGRFQRAHLGYLEDVLVELGKFDYADETGGGWPSYGDYPMQEQSTPVTNPWRDVGRNDPCPCGSGKKAKKCCLSR